MKGGRLAVISVIILLATVTMMAVVIRLLPDFWQLSPAAPAFIFLPFIFLRRFRLTNATGTSEQVLSDLVRRLRMARYQVSQSQHSLRVKVSSATALAVHVRDSGKECEVTYQVNLTPDSTGTLAVIVLFTGGFFLVPAAVFLLIKASSFAEGGIVPQIPRGGTPTSLEGADDIRSELIDGLSEGYRLSYEAYETTWSTYTTAVASLLLIGIIVWVTVFGLVSFGGFLSVIISRVADSALLATAVALPLTIIPLQRYRRRWKPRVNDYWLWSNRLHHALASEADRITTADSQSSTFELIVRACSEVPKWLADRRRGGYLTRESNSLMLYSILGTLTIWLLYQSVSYNLGFGSVNMIVIIVSVLSAFIVAEVWLHRKVKRGLRGEERAVIADWTLRMQRTKAKMERYLQDL